MCEESEKIMGNIPRPEHPFPQMKRENWNNLNGTWEFEFDYGNSGLDREFHKRDHLKDEITVPFCPESQLSGIDYKDFIAAVWYKRTLEIKKEDLDGRVIVHFGAVDYEARIYINGVEGGRHKGGYTSFQFDITSLLTVGSNDITVYARDDVRSGLVPRGKQSELFYSHGCDYTRTTGIWQTVWLEFVPKDYIINVKYYPNIEDATLHIKGNVSGKGTIAAKAYFEGRLCGSNQVHSYGEQFDLTISLTETHLWDVGVGNLYDLELTFGEDQIESYFGLREIRMEDMKFYLNGKSVFQRLVLDQGFYPDGIYTASTEEALIKDIQISMDMGFNGARLHQKVFEPRFLYHCDRMGYLVWGEMANWGLDLSNPLALHAFLPEWVESVNRDFNHPAIVGWCPFNETWDSDGRKQIDDTIRIIYNMTKELDSTRPCIDTSGNFHVVTDIYDLHNYNQNVDEFKAYYEPLKTGGPAKDDHEHRQSYVDGLPIFISEYGGIKWNVDESNATAWGYGEGPKTEEEFLKRYEGLTKALLENPKIFGFCYTQLYDVEQETNGLYQYDRTAKFNPMFISDINTQKAAIED